jgi:hypothetical protein
MSSAHAPAIAAKETVEINFDDPDCHRGRLKPIGGSQSDHWNNVLINQTCNALGLKPSDKENCEQRCSAAVTALVGIGPKDEMEGMLAAQLLAAHNAAMECYRRAMGSEVSCEVRQENLTQANKLSRTHAVLLDALNRHRGKAQQKVTVEHVHVHSGGQAVVGTVATPGGGEQMKFEDQPHARRIAHASQSAMWSANKDEGGEPVPSACDGEWPLPDARWDRGCSQR